MARSNNYLLKDVSGAIGKEIVIKQYHYGTVVTKFPDMSKVKWSKLQKKERNLFSEAVAYAQEIIRDTKKKAAFQKKIKNVQSVYHAAIKEYLKKNKKQH